MQFVFMTKRFEIAKIFQNISPCTRITWITSNIKKISVKSYKKRGKGGTSMDNLHETILNLSKLTGVNLKPTPILDAKTSEKLAASLLGIKLKEEAK